MRRGVRDLVLAPPDEVGARAAPEPAARAIEPGRPALRRPRMAAGEWIQAAYGVSPGRWRGPSHKDARPVRAQAPHAGLPVRMNGWCLLRSEPVKIQPPVRSAGMSAAVE